MKTSTSIYVFFGGLDRYDFKILGKQEMYVPITITVSTRAGKGGRGGDSRQSGRFRYELHRVWVIEGKLADGKHHVAPGGASTSTKILVCGLQRQLDEKGRLWKFGHGTMYLVPDLPAVVLGSQFVYDLLLGGYVYGFAFNDEPVQYKITRRIQRGLTPAHGQGLEASEASARHAKVEILAISPAESAPASPCR